MVSKVGVQVTYADLCMYGMQARRQGGRALDAARKPTKLMTNSARIGEELKRTCNQAHRHQRLMGSDRAKGIQKSCVEPYVRDT